MRPLERRWFTAESNWKVAIENYNECYHCPTAHPSFSRGVVLPETYTIRPVGQSLQHRAESSPEQYYEIDHEASPHAADYRSFYLWPALLVPDLSGTGTQHLLLEARVGGPDSRSSGSGSASTARTHRTVRRVAE